MGYVWRMGAGAQPALMLHCSMAHSGAWRAMAAHLGADLDMVAMDLPGHGKSPDWDGAGDLQDLALDWAIEATGGRAMHVIGHSFGATVALRLAQRRPDLVRSLALYEPVFFAVARVDAPEAFALILPDMTALKSEVAEGRFEAAARRFMAVWGDGTPWETLPEAARAGFARRIPLITAVNDGLCFDPGGHMAQLGAIRAPSLIMEGARSPAIMHPVQKGIAARIPGATHLSIDGAGHMGVISHAREIATAIRAHIAGLSAQDL